MSFTHSSALSFVFLLSFCRAICETVKLPRAKVFVYCSSHLPVSPMSLECELARPCRTEGGRQPHLSCHYTRGPLFKFSDPFPQGCESEGTACITGAAFSSSLGCLFFPFQSSTFKVRSSLISLGLNFFVRRTKAVEVIPSLEWLVRIIWKFSEGSVSWKLSIVIYSLSSAYPPSTYFFCAAKTQLHFFK